MWFFTEIADGFDRRVHEDEVFLDRLMKEDAEEHLRGENTFGFYATATLQAIHTLSTPVTRSFVDVLRIGDGVKKGGWGYGEDALRALVVAGPALRGLRWAAGLVGTVDANAYLGNCTWVAAARSMRLTGRLFTSVADLSKMAGIDFEALSWNKTIEELGKIGGAWVENLVKPLQQLGADVELITPKNKAAFSTMDEVFQAARRNRDGVVMFSVRWTLPNGKPALHTLIARWGPMGVRIIDRTSIVAKSLQELQKLAPAYGAIGRAVPVGRALVVANSIAVRVARTLPSVLNLIALEVKPAIVRKADSAQKPAQVAPAAPAKVPRASSTTTNMGRVTVHTTCMAPNSDSPEICSRYYTYQVVAGDSLSKIAQYAYKDGARWKLIYEANKAILGPNPHNPAALKAGMELFIPSR